MRLTSLTLKNFRNYARAEFRPHEGFNYIFGDNGAGKTNLLEAIYFLSHLRSFRRVSREKMVRHAQGGMYASGAFLDDGGGREIRLEAAFQGRDRRYKKDGREVQGLMPYLESSHVIVFFPETPGIIKEGPAVRRRFFDRAIAAVEPLHIEDSRRYAKILSERNWLLRNEGESGMLRVWRERLTEVAARIVARRKRYMQSLESRLGRLEGLFGEARQARLSVGYEANGLRLGDGAGEEEIREGLCAAARRVADEERTRRTTLWGPHLDDFRLSWDGHRARDVASQGEQRLMTILLVSANAEEYKDRKKEGPIVLLDDLGSELDANRKRRVLTFLGSLGTQTFITSAERPPGRAGDAGGKNFLVHDGVVEEVGRTRPNHT